MNKNFSYENIALSGVSMYNLGYPLEEVKKIVERTFKIKVSFQTLESWLQEYEGVCDYCKLREEAISLYNFKNVVFSKKFHHRQVYKFQYHRAKMDIEEKNGGKKNIPLLREYFQWVGEERKTCPEDKSKNSFPHHIFNGNNLEQRASKAKIKGDLPFKAIEKEPSKLLAWHALMMAKNNYERHEKVQTLMLLNDSSTLATEVPVYLKPKDLNSLKEKGFSFSFNNDYFVTGHIDLIKIRENKVFILDYKPNAEKEKPFAQLISYALGLSSRSKIEMKDIKCAWFDEKSFFEFSPLDIVSLGKQSKLI